MSKKNGELTRKEKKEINKAIHRESQKKIREAKKELIEQITDDDFSLESLIAAGLSIEDACQKVKMSTQTFYVKLREDEEFRQKITRAREIALDAIEDKIRSTASKPPREIIDAQGNKIYDRTELQWRDQIIDVEKWFLSVKNPAKYSGKSQEINIQNNQINIATQAIDDKLNDIITVKTTKGNDIRNLV